MKLDRAKIESLIRQLLIEIGEDPQREGLVRDAETRRRGDRVPHLRLAVSTWNG